MTVHELFSVAGSECRSFFRSGLLWKLSGALLLLLTSVTFASWPRVAAVGDQTIPLTWNWFCYVSMAALSYIALTLASDAVEAGGRVPMYEWVYYEAARPVSVVIARGCAVLLFTLILWSMTVPIAVVAYAASPLSIDQLVGAALITLTLVVIATAAGSIVGASVTERTFRWIAVLTIIGASSALLLIVGGWIGPSGAAGIVTLNPLGAMHHFLDADSFAIKERRFPWASWTALYGTLVLILGASAYIRLRGWLPADDRRITLAGTKGTRTDRAKDSANTHSGGEPL